MVDKKVVHVAGKRKTAIARATIKGGQGMIRVNSIPLELYSTSAVRMRIKESLMIAADYVDIEKIDMKITVEGGGVMGQADAITSAISRGMVKWTNNDELLNRYTTYDRTLIAGDHRLTETHKPGQSSKGPRHKRQKSYR